LQSNSVIFKNNKTGKVEQFPGIEVETSEWLKRARGHCLKRTDGRSVVTIAHMFHAQNGFIQLSSF
jgi:hypothetical protein